MKPRIAITMGEYNGIGPEITLRSILPSRIRKICTPILIGSIDVYEYYAKRLGLKINLIEMDSTPRRLSPDEIAVFHLRKFQTPVLNPGIPSTDAGGYAGEAIEIAASLCLQGFTDGMVTAPISKTTLNAAGYKYPGQTEFLAALCGSTRQTMMLVSGKFRVALASIHIPLKIVPSSITKALLTEKIRTVYHSCKYDFGIQRPRIAMLSLNPHAGEDGLMGNEEVKTLIPVIKAANKKKMYVDGPFPSDGFFGTQSHTAYDAVLAMYHDQGLIPLKMAGFSSGVNFTAGLPIVRTSPDHGTAFEIAGKGIADPSSMIEAIRVAVNIIANRNHR